MRYTRYEYKKSGRLKFLCSVAVIVGVSIGGGLYISNMVFHGKEITNINNSNTGDLKNEDSNDKLQSVIALQCGYFSKEENTKEILNSISKYCKPFVVEEDGKYRVLAGIYTEEEAAKKIKEFKDNNIDVAKVSLNLSDNIENKKLLEVVNGFITIINKLQDNDVKSIKTAEFKSWADKIINNDNNKSKKLSDLNDYINKLPDEIDKMNNNTNMEQLYRLIKN